MKTGSYYLGTQAALEKGCLEMFHRKNILRAKG